MFTQRLEEVKDFWIQKSNAVRDFGSGGQQIGWDLLLTSVRANPNDY